MIRLPKCLRAMLKLRASEPGRFPLHGIGLFVGADGRQHVQVTDGRVLASATLSRDENDDTEPETHVVANSDDVDDLMRLKPKDMDVRVDARNASDAAIPAVVATESGDIAGSVRRCGGNFPTTDPMWPTATKAEARVILVVDNLLNVVRACKAIGAGSVTLTIYGESRPVLVEPTAISDGLESFHVLVAPVSLMDDEKKAASRALPQIGYVAPRAVSEPANS